MPLITLFIIRIIAVLTGAVRRSSRRSLVDRCAVSGRVPCSGAERRGKVLDAVSTAIPGGGAAGNVGHHRRGWSAAESPSVWMPLLAHIGFSKTIHACIAEDT